MPKLKDIMTTGADVIYPDASLKEVAEKMKNRNCGAIPVCDGERLVGMITDRDIVMRTLAVGRDPNATRARDVMSTPIAYCFEEEDVSQAVEVMEKKQIRRLVVLNRDMNLVGIVSLGDIARKAGSEQLSGEALEKISGPSRIKAA